LPARSAAFASNMQLARIVRVDRPHRRAPRRAHVIRTRLRPLHPGRSSPDQ
jgi:hypothetical protein